MSENGYEVVQGTDEQGPFTMILSPKWRRPPRIGYVNRGEDQNSAYVEAQAMVDAINGHVHALDLLGRLNDWNATMGVFESPVWDETEKFLRDNVQTFISIRLLVSAVMQAESYLADQPVGDAKGYGTRATQAVFEAADHVRAVELQHRSGLKSPTPWGLSVAEAQTIYAALRFWRAAWFEDPMPCINVARSEVPGTDRPSILGIEEIDGLCARLQGAWHKPEPT